MSETQTNTSNDVTAVRAALMHDLAPVDVFAAAVGKSVRTVLRYIAQKKVPTVTMGRTPYVVISQAREALMAEAQTGHKPVRRGRPPNKIAA